LTHRGAGWHLRSRSRLSCPKEERDELVLAEPHKFWIADHEASFAWVCVRLAALDDVEELRAILTDSWRQAATPRLLEQHPELRGERYSPHALRSCCSIRDS
jgi:hypothetical protein